MFHLNRALFRGFSENRTSGYKYSQLCLGSRCLVQGWWNSRSVSQTAGLCKEEKDPPPEITPRKEEKNPPPDETPTFVNNRSEDYRKQYDNPFQRTFRIMADDVTQYFGISSKRAKQRQNQPGDRPKEGVTSSRVWPSDCDVLIVGGGIMGSSIAYHLQERALDGLKVVVVEEDSSYKKASTVLSVGGIRQQFSCPENIFLSRYGAEFLRKAPEWLAIPGMDTPNMNYNPQGYLTLASELGVKQLWENYELQRECGAKVDFLSAARLKERFPWINTEGVEAGVIGNENEGWFDPWSLLIGLRRKAVSYGTQIVDGKLTGLHCSTVDDVILEGVSKSNIQQLSRAEITLPSGKKQSIEFAILVVAAGAWTGEVGRLVGIGDGEGMMGVPIPIEPRKRYVYCVHGPDGPGLDTPIVIDPNGTYFRREGLGGLYLCGQSPDEDNEPSVENLDVDHDFFYNQVWPSIAHRVPSFEKLKMKSAWAGYYDYNYFDQNGIIGLHPLFSNMFIAAGFSGHGIQQGAGVGRAIMECIMYGEYKTINLERFGFHRIIADEPLYELNIV